MFVTSQGSAHGRFTRAIRARNVFQAELAALELEGVSLDDALQLVYLYAEAGSSKYEKAVRRYLERWIVETEPSLKELAATARTLVEQRQR